MICALLYYDIGLFEKGKIMIFIWISYPAGSPFVLGAGERADLTEGVDSLLLTVDTSGQEGLLLEGQEVPKQGGSRRTCQTLHSYNI